MRQSGITRRKWLDRPGWGRILLVFGIVAGLAALVAAAEDGAEPTCRRPATLKPVPVTITWGMAEGFGPGYDRNGDGRPDLPNSSEYVNSGRYEVQLTAGVDAIGLAPADLSCLWTIDGRDGAIPLRATGPHPTVRLSEGAFSAQTQHSCYEGQT
jgi:hypothetical protein